MRRGICFDLDGTLLQPHGDWLGWVTSLARSLAVPETQQGAFRHALERATERSGALTLALACRSALASIGRDEPADLDARAHHACNAYARGVHADPDAAALLARLAAAGVPLAAVTNGPVDMQRAALRCAGLERWLRITLVSGAAEVAVRKPHPRMFWQAVTALRVRPEDALMVGDDLEADVWGAHRFGLATCWLARVGAAAPYRPPPPGTVIVPDLAAAGAYVDAFLSG